MDKLAQQLRQDAARIDVSISDELEHRIEASLQGATQEAAAAPDGGQPLWFWWASSLTGIAATLALIVVLNLPGGNDAAVMTQPPPPTQATTMFEWNLKPAMLTQTLEQEMVAIQSDLKKAEQRLRDDIEQVGVDSADE